jgi:multisubunit Na+/H+ antiporter MnhB subunit
MDPPLLSTITLFTEIIITVLIVYVFYNGYRWNKFPFRIATFALTYEILFNISYMIYSALTHEHREIHSPLHIWLAIFHGIFSLVMFIALVILLIIAYRKYRKKVNFFRKHRLVTFLFVILWMIAVFSGILFYFVAYFNLF